jgi:DNA mismatch endonuclease, patch repair protein
MAQEAELTTTSARSELMRRVRQRGTAPELVVRQVLTRIGARYRVNVRGLSGTPDLANRKRRKAVFVHGCFWHAHRGCPKAKVPKTNSSFWADKLHANRVRDAAKVAGLARLGYDVEVVWECELGDVHSLTERLRRFWQA